MFLTETSSKVAHAQVYQSVTRSSLICENELWTLSKQDNCRNEIFTQTWENYTKRDGQLKTKRDCQVNILSECIRDK